MDNEPTLLQTAAVPDLRLILRRWLINPLFTLVSIFSIAIGIGAMTTVFAVADVCFWRPREGVKEPSTLVDIGRGAAFDNFSYPLYEAFRGRAAAVAMIAAYRPVPQSLSRKVDDGTEERVTATLVSADFFKVIGTQPAAGRFFRDDEDAIPGERPVAVLSETFWQRRFRGSRDAVGTAMRLNGVDYTIVGVTERGFSGLTLINTDIWVPMAMQGHVTSRPDDVLRNPQTTWHIAIGRLHAGKSPAQLRDHLNAILRDEAVAHPLPYQTWDMNVALSTVIPAPIRPAVMGVTAILALLALALLLVVSTNVSLLLAVRRADAMAATQTQFALGATRQRIIVLAWAEVTLLFVAGGVLSVAASAVFINTLVNVMPNLPIPLRLDPRLDLRSLIVDAVVTAAATVAVALPLAAGITSESLNRYHVSVRPGDVAGRRLRYVLIGVQVFTSVILLALAGMSLQSIANGRQVPIGFNARDVFVTTIDTTSLGAARGEWPVLSRFAEKMQSIEHFDGVAMAVVVPLQGSGLNFGLVETAPDADARPATFREVDWNIVSPDYFPVLQMPLSRGRTFSTADSETAAHAAIVNEVFAKNQFKQVDPIGRTITFQPAGSSTPLVLRIVGVASNAKYRSLGESDREAVFLPLAQWPRGDVRAFIRTKGLSAMQLRAALQAAAPELTWYEIRSLTDVAELSLVPQKLIALVAVFTGLVSLALSCAGIYGVCALVSRARSHEIALRMALGARVPQVYSALLTPVVATVGLGLAAGVMAAVMVTMISRQVLIGIAMIDVPSLAVASAMLAITAFLATILPLRKAVAADPARLLRNEAS